MYGFACIRRVIYRLPGWLRASVNSTVITLTGVKRATTLNLVEWRNLVKRYPGFHHESLNELERARPVGDVVAWLEARIG